jgi:hypothetical protein
MLRDFVRRRGLLRGTPLGVPGALMIEKRSRELLEVGLRVKT